MALSTTSPRRRHVTLPSVCMLLQQYSLDHTVSQAMLTGGGEHAPPGSLPMAPPPDANRPFPSTPPVYPWLRRGSNLYGTRRFYLSGTRRFYLDSLAEYRSPNSPLLVPPLLRLGFVGVLISVPVALVIKRAGYTHTHDA